MREINRKAFEAEHIESGVFHGRTQAINHLFEFIISLQQEPLEKSKKDCNVCLHCVDRKDQYGWHFKGCFGGPYKGKWIAEIDKCPLQQEQPKVDLVAELKYHLATTPKEQLEKECKELEPWGNIGPTIQEFLYGKQPEMDLEKFTEKMDAWKARYNHSDNIPIKATMAFTARMFYMYPEVAREWYESLPKATMD